MLCCHFAGRSWLLVCAIEGAKAINALDRTIYEFNARSILTMREPFKDSCPRDNASRQWNGLLGDFYTVR